MEKNTIGKEMLVGASKKNAKDFVKIFAVTEFVKNF